MIDYQTLADSCTFYEKLAYQRLEAPWWVTQDILNITKPEEAFEEDRATYFLEHNKKCLVASGEQSFLYMAAKGHLPTGRFYTITPCFRDESITQLSCKNFMKTELIETGTTHPNALKLMIEDAFQFFASKVPDGNKLKIVKTDMGYDIEYDGIEVGSYGVRSCFFLDWVYGTGVAEPRLSNAIKRSLIK